MWEQQKPWRAVMERQEQQVVVGGKSKRAKKRMMKRRKNKRMTLQEYLNEVQNYKVDYNTEALEIIHFYC